MDGMGGVDRGLGVGPVADTLIVGRVVLGHRTSAMLASTKCAVVTNVCSGCLNLQVHPSVAHTVCGMRVRLRSTLRAYRFVVRLREGNAQKYE